MVKATGSIAGVLVPTILVFFFIYTPWEARVVVKYQSTAAGTNTWESCWAMCCWPLPPAPPATVRAGAVAGQYHPVTAAEVRHRGRYLPRHLAGRHRTHGGVEAAVGAFCCAFLPKGKKAA